LKAIGMWKALFDAGVYTNVAVPPAVPAGSAVLRTSYMAAHTDEQMDRVIDRDIRPSWNSAGAHMIPSPMIMATRPIRPIAISR